MKTATKALAVISAVCLMLCGCAEGKTDRWVTDSLEGREVLVGNIPCEFPLSEEQTKLNALACTNNSASFDDVYVLNRYEKMTNVDISWTTVTSTERSAAVEAALAEGQPYDLILRCKVSATRLTKYGESGQILDLAKDDLLKNNAPNCWAYLQAHPDALASVTNPDGAIYALPQINSGAELRVSRKLFINKNWLKAVDMELPTTTEELYLLLKAFKEQDANGNGDPNDEIPICLRDWVSAQEAFSGAFGLMNRGSNNQLVDCDETTGKVRLSYASEDYREFLKYFNRLYTEGLIDADIFEITADEWEEKALNDRIGVYASTNLSSFPSGLDRNWIGINEALEGPGGSKQWTAIRANFHSTGNAIIPATCKDPALVLRWLDYFWTDEGTLFYHMGVEGETFVVNDDGSYNYAQKIYDEIASSGLSFDEVVSRYSPYPGGGNPTVEVSPYFRGGEMAAIPAATARKLFEYGPDEYWPSFTFTADETEKLSAITSKLNGYCTDMMRGFITGETPLSAWDGYVAQLGEYGAEELVEIYQTALERYHTLVAAHGK